MDKSRTLFSLPNYPAWFGADTLLLAGSAVHWIIMSVMAYQLTGSITIAGWFTTVRGITSTVTQITGGTFIDRHDHRTLILVQAGCSTVIWLSMGLLFISGNLTFPLFAGLCLSSSMIFGFLGGTTNAALIRVVGPKLYARAESLNQGRDAAVNTAGSPLGAVLFGINQAFPFFASALCDALAFVSALFLRLPPEDLTDGTAKGEASESGSFVADLVDGWRWALSSKTIVSIVIVICICQFAVFAVHQAVNLSLVELGTDPLLISLSNVGMATGTMMGSFISMRICDRIHTGKGIVAVFAIMALAFLPMIVWSTYPVIIVCTFCASLPMPLFSALANGFVFSKTPVVKQGRTRAAVITVIMLFATSSGAVAGELMPRIGFSGFVVVLVALLLVAALIAGTSPHIKRLPVPTDWDTVDL